MKPIHTVSMFKVEFVYISIYFSSHFKIHACILLPACLFFVHKDATHIVISSQTNTGKAIFNNIKRNNQDNQAARSNVQVFKIPVLFVIKLSPSIHQLWKQMFDYTHRLKSNIHFAKRFITGSNFNSIHSNRRRKKWLALADC